MRYCNKAYQRLVQLLSCQNGHISGILLFQIYYFASLRRYLISLYKNKARKVKLSELYLNWIKSKVFIGNSPSSASTKILIDFFPVESWVVVNSVVARFLQDFHGSKLESYGSILPQGKFGEVYKSMGAKTHKITIIPCRNLFKGYKMFMDLRRSCESLRDFIELSVENIKVGEIVYDSILRTGVPTVSPKSKEASQTLFQTVQIFLFCEKYFLQNQVSAVILSHDNYVDMGLVARYANSRGIPVYLANCHEISISRSPYSTYQKYRYYREYFSRLSSKNQALGIEWARSRLEQRTSGDFKIDNYYQEASAFSKIMSKTLQVDNPRAIVIATHCFFDSPHGLGGMVYEDFFTWIVDTLRYAKEREISVYLKTHPDFLPGTLEVVDTIQKMFPSINLISSNTTWQEILNSGLNNVVTCYGTVGTELPYLGFNVVNAGYNSRIAYSFNLHSQSRQEYYNNIDLVTSSQIIFDEMELFEYYYMHYKFTLPDDFIFQSFHDLYFRAKSQEEVYVAEFLKNEKEIIAKLNFYLEEMLTTNLDYTFEIFLKEESSL